MRRFYTSWYSLGAVFIFTSLLLAASTSPPLVIGDYELLSITPAPRGHFDFTYRARATNTGASAYGKVRARLTRPPEDSPRVVDGRLRFRQIAAGGSAESADVFILRRALRKAFDPKLLARRLEWEILANAVPVADAGADQAIAVGALVQLDASGSTDADGDPLHYHWRLTAKPAGSTASLSHPRAVRPTFTADLPGTYTAGLIVNDRHNKSLPDTVILTAGGNTAPVAAAGPDQTVAVGATVHLDASGSSDVDGDPLSFAWRLVQVPAGSTAALSDPNAVAPSFTADVAGDYLAELTVNDGTSDSAPDTVTVSTENSAPVADAGPDQSVPVGDLVQLDGSGSTDVDGDRLEFFWSVLSAPADSTAAPSDPTAVKPTLSIDKAGEYVIQLTVSDGQLEASDTVTLTTENSPPVADAGPDQSVSLGATVALDGSRSADADNDTLSYRWSFLSQPAGSTAGLSDPAAAQPSFVADVPGSYFAQLIVNDGTVDSAPDEVVITTANSRPVSNAGPDQSATVGHVVALDGSTSTDADGDTLSYAWALTSVPTGSTAALSDPSVANPSFTPDLAGTYMAQLIVNDGTLDSEPDTVVITANAVEPPLPPVIESFDPTSAPIGTLVTLRGANFEPSSGAAAQVILANQDGGVLAAPLASVTATEIRFTIPAGAATGPITVTAGGQSTTSTDLLTIVPSSDFTLKVEPATASVIQGQSVHYAVALETSNGFAQLASLSVDGLPPGANAAFDPPQLAVGQTGVLTITVPADQPLGSASLSVTASASVEGSDVNQTAGVALEVLPVTTSFMGQAVMADAAETPLAGVTVTILALDGNGNPTDCKDENGNLFTTVTDAAGNFAFTDLPDGCAGGQLIRYDGSTVEGGAYAGVDLFYTLVEGQVTVSPVLIHLPSLAEGETVNVVQNAAFDQTFTFASIPNLAVTVYAGTVFTLVDGTQPDPFPLIAIQVPIDRLPDAKPANPAMLMVFIVAFQPANATASQPVAVYFPNTVNTPPLTPMPLLTLDPTLGMMVQYGTGTVATNGTQIVPDLDPAFPGHRYGLVHFDWHGPMPPPPPPTADGMACRPGTCCPIKGDPIDLSSGFELMQATDMEIRGGRGSASIVRTYYSGSNLAGPFGIGTRHNYGDLLDADNLTGSELINLLDARGNRFPFVRQEEDGTLINSTIPRFQGAVMSIVNGTAELRYKDGTVYRFLPRTATLGFIGSTLESITDPNGNTVTLVRDAADANRITEVVDAVGRRLFLSYDDADRITAITDPIGPGPALCLYRRGISGIGDRSRRRRDPLRV